MGMGSEQRQQQRQLHIQAPDCHSFMNIETMQCSRMVRTIQAAGTAAANVVKNGFLGSEDGMPCAAAYTGYCAQQMGKEVAAGIEARVRRSKPQQSGQCICSASALFQKQTLTCTANRSRRHTEQCLSPRPGFTCSTASATSTAPAGSRTSQARAIGAVRGSSSAGRHATHATDEKQ
jgi:hypothetical protein